MTSQSTSSTLESLYLRQQSSDRNKSSTKLLLRRFSFEWYHFRPDKMTSSPSHMPKPISRPHWWTRIIHARFCSLFKRVRLSSSASTWSLRVRVACPSTSCLRSHDYSFFSHVISWLVTPGNSGTISLPHINSDKLLLNQSSQRSGSPSETRIFHMNR